MRVMAAGICGSDIPRIFETEAHRHPLIPCYECASCMEKQHEMCRQYRYLGSRRDGGFAEYVVVPVRNLIEIPDKVSFDVAAMLEPMAVAVHAMRRAMPRTTDIVAFYGLGTIGLLLAMVLHDAGIANLLLVGNKTEQKALALQTGGPEDRFCDIRSTEARQWITERTQGHGADVVFECVGKNETIALAIQSAAAGGSVVLVGNPAADIEFSRDAYWNILRRQLTVRGTWNSSFTHEKKRRLALCLAPLGGGDGFAGALHHTSISLGGVRESPNAYAKQKGILY